MLALRSKLTKLVHAPSYVPLNSKMFRKEIFLLTLDSGINIPLRLLIFGIFSRGYGLITDLKDLHFTT